jgi:hypothetical protein
VLLDSLVKYRSQLHNAVSSERYAELAKIGMKNGRNNAQHHHDDDAPKELQDAEMQITDMEVGLYNNRGVPPALLGTKRFARVYQDITSLRYWEAVQVHT